MTQSPLSDRPPDTAGQDIFSGIGLDVLESAASFHLRILNLWVARYLEHAFVNTPLAGGTGKITTLILVANRPGITAREILPFAGKNAPTMTRLVDRLVSEGLLYRRLDPASKRRTQLFLTQAGHEMVTRIRQAIIQERYEVFGMLDQAEHDELTRLLRKVSDAHIRNVKGDASLWGTPWLNTSWS